MSDLHQAPAPTENQPVGNPATLPAGRDLAAERDAEMKADAAAASAKANRFTVKKRTALSRPAPSGPEYETLILKAAANNPLGDVDYPAVSTYVPNAATFYMILHVMDQLMASTKRWNDNSAGWAPPISQAYFAVLVIYQIFRAQHAAGIATGDMIVFLTTFEQTFPLSELWIPGPLVAAFRALSAFRPDENDLFGGVTPALPATPGWSNTRGHRLSDSLQRWIPNVSYFFSRLRDISDLATSGINDASWLIQTNGFNYVDEICGHAVTNTMMLAPGIRYALPGDRDLWRRSAAHLNGLGIPARLNATTAVANTWTAAICFENNEHHWFANCSAIMAKYCQFFHGSKPMSDLTPVNSATGALKIRFLPTTTIHDDLVATPSSGTGASHEHGNANQRAHLTLAQQSRVTFDCDLAVRDVPDAHIYSGMTFCFNAQRNHAEQMSSRVGPFWNLAPNCRNRRNVEVLPGLYSVIMREYHSDTRIPADKQ
jgi:hypothetical protein